MLGLLGSALAKVETGIRGISATELVRLAQALEMRVEWFFEDGASSSVVAPKRRRAGCSQPERGPLHRADRQRSRVPPAIR